MTRDFVAGPIRVEIWSDVQCVWCYLGESRWRTAIARFDREVDLVHRSFELQPGAPVDFGAAEYLLTHRGMSADQQSRAFDTIARVAAAEGLGYHPAQIRPTNSHAALELLHHADSVGMRDQVAARLYTAYFTEGRHIGRVDELVTLGAEAGLESVPARDALVRHEYAAAVDADQARAWALGVQGVPFHVIDDRYRVSGAQPSDVLLDLLNRAAAAR